METKIGKILDELEPGETELSKQEVGEFALSVTQSGIVTRVQILQIVEIRRAQPMAHGRHVDNARRHGKFWKTEQSSLVSYSCFTTR